MTTKFTLTRLTQLRRSAKYGAIPMTSMNAETGDSARNTYNKNVS